MKYFIIMFEDIPGELGVAKCQSKSEDLGAFIESAQKKGGFFGFTASRIWSSNANAPIWRFTRTSHDFIPIHRVYRVRFSDKREYDASEWGV